MKEIKFEIDKRMTKSFLINMLSNKIQESKKQLPVVNGKSIKNKVQVYTLSGIGCLIHALSIFLLSYWPNRTFD